MGQVDDRRRARNFAERGGILLRRCLQIICFNRHGMNLLRTQPSMRQQSLLQMGEISIGMSGWSHTLVDLHQGQAFPRNVLIGQRTKHQPWRASAADCHNVATTLSRYSASIICNELGSRTRRRVCIGKNFHLHRVHP